MDLVVTYFHPELGVVVVNPKNRAHWESVRGLKKNELVTMFAGAFQDTDGDKKYQEGISLLLVHSRGGEGQDAASIHQGQCSAFKKVVPMLPGPRTDSGSEAARAQAEGRTCGRRRRGSVPRHAGGAPVLRCATDRRRRGRRRLPARVAAATTAPKRMTPMYSIPVTNELFHNGNVEAWKKIIQSYTTKYPGLDVYVFYEGERIHDINTLFKWGKVKHGSAIMIAIAGDDIKDVAKLQRYLKQGASHMFEAFLKAQVGAILNLF